METIFTQLNSYSVLKTTTRSHLTTNIPYIVVHRIGNPHSTQAAIGWRAVYILRVFCEHSWKGSFWTGFGRDGSLLWGVVGGATHGVPFQPSSLLLPHLNSRQLSFFTESLRNSLLEVFPDLSKSKMSCIFLQLHLGKPKKYYLADFSS